MVRALQAALAAMALLACQAQAQLPGLGTEPAPVPIEVQVPDPRTLQSDWWTYIAGAGDAIEARAEALGLSVDQAVLSVTVAESEGLPELAERSRRNVQAYLDELEREPETIEATVRTSDTFTLSELLGIERTIWSTRIELQEESDRVDQGKNLLATARRRLDQVIQSYRGGSLDEIGRLRAGLNIISQRAELAQAELRLDRRKARADQLETYRKQLEGQVAYARKNLEADDWDAEAAQQNLAGLREQLDEATAGLTVWRDKILGLDESTVAGRVNALRVRQELLSALAMESRRKLELASFEAQVAWHDLHAVEDPISAADLKQPLAEFRFLLEDAEDEFDGWQRSNEMMVLEPALVPAESRQVELKAMEQRARALALETLREIRASRGIAAELELMIEILGKELAGAQSGLKGWLQRLRLVVLDGWNYSRGLLGEPLFHISDAPVTAGELVRSVLILLAALVLSAFIRKGLARIGRRRQADAHSLYAVGRLLHYLLITLGVVMGLVTLGLDLTNLALIAGALSVGIGFGLQNTVANFVSGLVLLFDRSLKVGDYVELDSGHKGTVKEVTVRATRINTNDNVDVLVPNSEFVSTKLTNWTLMEPFARLRIPFGVAYGSDKEKVRDIALAAADRVKLTLHHMPGKEPHVRLTGFGDSSLDFELLVWVSRVGVMRPGRTRANYYWELETGLNEAGIEIPFPQRDVHMKSDDRGARERPRPFRAPRRRE